MFHVKDYIDFLFETSQHYRQTVWSKKIGGRPTKIKIKEVEEYLDKKGVQAKEVPLAKILHLGIHADSKDKETLQRAKDSKLEYPILLVRGKDKKFISILDGNHRLLKAKMLRKKSILARILDLEDAPKNYQKMFS